MQLLKHISNVILIFFLTVGVVSFSVFIHERSHQIDYKNYVIEDKSETCILVDPFTAKNNSAGYYEYSYYAKNKEYIDEITKYSEIKAYILTGLVCILYLICWISFSYYNNKEN